jgi:hypothetical protein
MADAGEAKVTGSGLSDFEKNVLLRGALLDLLLLRDDFEMLVKALELVEMMSDEPKKAAVVNAIRILMKTMN